MLNPVSSQLRVGVDVGSRCHSVAIGLSDGSLLEEFDIPHTAEGFREFFARVEACGRRHAVPIAVAMEGYNGHVRPLDSLVRARGWQLFNVNNLKLARFKEIFPAAAKSDRIDSRKTLELFQLGDHLPMAGEVLQEVMATPEENNVLKRLSRRRRRLVNERARVINSMQADLQAVAPGLLEITQDVGNLWFLNFLTCRKDILKLARLRRSSLLEVPAIGPTYADRIQAWQQGACFGPDARLVGDMIRQDAERVLELNRQIKALEDQMAHVAERSSIACQLARARAPPRGSQSSQPWDRHPTSEAPAETTVGSRVARSSGLGKGSPQILRASARAEFQSLSRNRCSPRSVVKLGESSGRDGLR